MKFNLITFIAVFSLKAVIAAPTPASIGIMKSRESDLIAKANEESDILPFVRPSWLKLVSSE
ncbi:hypothetical protein K435DRAFT_867185 [Dendrothele bispora CBS 962.96]|uniref:Uncharacterized protein n=1 Tax=Dendrothele bispora (strain CBS 962.96) TaxID=1314807 RepID=A0A4S8LG88_DENBC|nr:hypothetical protein K435DRAFT_867185 [Dendrothele bispora CBS 962.96]